MRKENSKTLIKLNSKEQFYFALYKNGGVCLQLILFLFVISKKLSSVHCVYLISEARVVRWFQTKISTWVFWGPCNG
jgi:hypothetical protein